MLRAVGARHVVELIVLETLLVVAGCVLGVGSLYGLIALAIALGLCGLSVGG